MQGTTEAQLTHTAPGDNAPAPIGAQAAHIITSLDGVVNGMIAQQQPLMAGSHAGKTGVSQMPEPGVGFSREWSSSVQVDTGALHEYGSAVFESVDNVLAGMSDADLERQLEGAGDEPRSVGEMLGLMILNTYSHTGEISALKGLQGTQGYPV